MLSVGLTAGLDDMAAQRDAISDAPPRTGPPGSELISNYDKWQAEIRDSFDTRRSREPRITLGATALQGVA